MSNFEEAKHQGYSTADMAADMAEAQQRLNDLGCPICKWGEYRSPACYSIFEDVTKIVCPYFRKEGE